MWRPHPEALRAIRQQIVADGEGWREATVDPGLGDSLQLGGESLKRAPRGFDAAHPLIDDIKRKSFIAVATLNQTRLLGRGFLDEFTGSLRGRIPADALCLPGDRRPVLRPAPEAASPPSPGDRRRPPTGSRR